MADATIELVGPEELPVIIELYNHVSPPTQSGFVPAAISRALQHHAYGSAHARTASWLLSGF